MLSFVRRMSGRPSGRLTRAVLVPLSALFLMVCVYSGFLVFQAGNRLDSARISTTTRTLALTWNPSQDPEGLSRLAADEGWERVWIVSATGRIVSSSQNGEAGSSVDASFWNELPSDQVFVERTVERRSGPWMQFAYHDVARGQWAMVVIPDRESPVPFWVLLTGFLFLSAVIWSIMALAVATVIHRHMELGIDAAVSVARKVLDGEPVPESMLARDKADSADDGPASLVVLLAARLQDQARRSREAESRFASLLDLLPGAMYVASFEGRMLVSGGGFRQRMIDPAIPTHGRMIENIPSRIPLATIHDTAVRLRDAHLTVSSLPVGGDGDPASVRASIALVAFRGVEGYLAYVEDGETGHAATDGLASSTTMSLLDATHDLVVAFDADARTLVWNRTLERLTGVSRVEVPDLKRVVSVLFKPSGAEASFMTWLEHQPSSGELETVLRPADGKDRVIRWSAIELTTQGSAIGGALIGRVMEPSELPSTATPAPERKPTVKKPTVKKPTVKKPAAKEPAAKGPAVKKPAAMVPAAEKPAAEKPARPRNGTSRKAETKREGQSERG